MKKTISIILLTLLSSCSLPSYYFENNMMETGLDFTKGKWILNTIEVPYDVEKYLSNRVFNDFSEKLGDRISHSKNVKEFIITPKINLNENKSELGKIHKTTGYDYLITLKAQVLKNQLGSIDYSSTRTNEEKKNEVKVVIQIFDLKSQLLIYEKTAIGLSGFNNSTSASDVNFSKSSDMLIIGAYNKIIKDINKKSIAK